MMACMKIVQIITGVVLCLTFLLAGLGVCLLPPVTHVLAGFTVKTDVSPFTRTQLVKVADATRDYSFGSHDLLELYQVIYDIDRAYANDVASREGVLDPAFPDLDLYDAARAAGAGSATSSASSAAASSTSSGAAAVAKATRTAQLGAVFTGASEVYAYSPATISHLDDCYNLASAAFPLAITIAVLALVGLVVARIWGGRRDFGGILVGAGVGTMLLFAACGVWAFLDFSGFFGSLHSLFFAAGTWTFPSDSLLICALPTTFWMGMGIIWLSVVLLMSILSIVFGVRARRRS